MQDNAPPHRHRSTLELFASRNVQLMEWPPQSPDLNPIENVCYILLAVFSSFFCAQVWRKLKAAVRKRQPHSTKGELWKATQEEFDKLTPEFFDSLNASMCQRVKDVLTAKGGHTKY